MAITGGITLLQKLQKLYGARAVTDRLGKMTNVQTTAQGANNPFAGTFSKKYLGKNQDGIDEAHNVIMDNMQFAFGNKNPQQMKNFETNVNILFDMKFPPAKAEAEILDLSTKKQVTGKGLDSLKDKMGLPQGVTKFPEQQAREYSANIESYRRPIIRQMLLKDTKIKLPDNVRKSLENKMDLDKGADPKMDPLRLLDEYYDVNFAKLDELEDIRFTARNETEAADEFLKKGGLEPKKDLGDKLKDLPDDIDPDAMAQGGIAGQLHMNRTGYDMGGAAGTELAITQALKDFKRYQKSGGKLSYKKFIASGNEGVSRFFNKGGRVGFKNGGMDRRTFLKLMGGLASLPVVGKLFKGAKVASKVVPLKGTTTTMPAWFPDLVDKFVAKGVGKKIDADMMEYTVKELPDVKMVERTDGMISVEGKNAYNEDYFIQYEPPGYTVVDEKTGKAVKTKGEFVATDTEYRMVSPEDYDIDGVNVDNIDEILGGSSNQLEGFAKGTGKTKNTIGQKRIDEADARGASSTDRADINDPYKDMDPTDFGDPEDFATGGRVGMLSGGGVLKTIIQNLAKERGVKPSYLLEMINVKSLPKQIRDKMSPKEIKGFLEKRIEQVKNFKEMMSSRFKFNQSIQQGKALDDKGTGMSDIFDLMDQNFTKGSPVPKNVNEESILQMEQMIKNMEMKDRKLNAKGGLAGQLL